MNYDSFSIPKELIDTYLKIKKPVFEEFYIEVTRFAGNAEMREKLAERFSQNALAPSIFGTEEEAERGLSWPDLK